MFRLAGTPLPPPSGPPRHVRPCVRDLIDRLPETGAIVTSAAYDVAAWNPLAKALLGSSLCGQPKTADPGSASARALRHLAGAMGTAH